MGKRIREIMKKIPSKLKAPIYILLAWVSFCLILELLSFVLLLTLLKNDAAIDYADSRRLVRLFPAQIRMSADEIRKTFPRDLPAMRTGSYLSFPFDPVLGFRTGENIEWYGDASKENLKSKFLIVTFGGSTTVRDSWAKHLAEHAKAEKVRQDIVILNAGHWGYMTFNEKIYFTSWIMPMLEDMGKKPDLVITMDGVNDVWSRIMGYLESRAQKSPVWFSQYHGYHQQLDTDIRGLSTVKSSAGQLFSNLSRLLYRGAVDYLSPLMPYTCKAVLESMRRFMQAPVKVDEAARSAAIKKITLENYVEDRIIGSYRNALLDFYGAASARGIKFVAYLQPVLLPRYHAYPTPKGMHYPSIDYFAVNFYSQNMYWSRFECAVVETDHLYAKAAGMYRDLDRLHPGSFESLLAIFKQEPKTDQLYNKDAIHYEPLGKKLIAEAVVRDLISKKILSR